MEAVSTVASTIIGLMGDVINEVITHPVLLVGIGAGLVFTGVKLVKRFTKVG